MLLLDLFVIITGKYRKKWSWFGRKTMGKLSWLKQRVTNVRLYEINKKRIFIPMSINKWKLKLQALSLSPTAELRHFDINKKGMVRFYDSLLWKLKQKCQIQAVCYSSPSLPTHYIIKHIRHRHDVPFHELVLDLVAWSDPLENKFCLQFIF